MTNGRSNSVKINKLQNSRICHMCVREGIHVKRFNSRTLRILIKTVFKLFLIYSNANRNIVIIRKI